MVVEQVEANSRGVRIMNHYLLTLWRLRMYSNREAMINWYKSKPNQ